MRKVLALFVCAVIAVAALASEPLKMAVITDTHFLSSKLAGEGTALAAFEQATGRNVADLHEALHQVLNGLQNERTDVLLIAGDITNHGERQSHLDFIEKLNVLQQNGTRIFVVPGNHDINVPDAKKYTGEGPQPTESVSAEEFAQLYAPFGYGNALKKDTASLSYLVALSDSLWLLCFDTNRYAENKTSSISGGRILPQTLNWALEILRQANEKGIVVMGMMHHGLVEHMPYQSTFFSAYLVDDWQKEAAVLADAGMKVVFTGHFHSNDVSLFTSSAGNPVYDVATGSLAQYPFAYRLMTLDAGKLSIDTRFVTSIPGNPNFEKIYREKLETITRRVALSRLRGMGIPFPEPTLNALADVLVQLNVLHVRGDEKPNEELKQSVRRFAELLGDEAETDEFVFDFPPEDNRLVIELDKR